MLRQPQFAPLSLAEQVALLLAVSEGLLDEVPLDQLDPLRASLGSWLAQQCPEALALDDQTTLSEDLRERLMAAVQALARSVVMPATADQG